MEQQKTEKKGIFPRLELIYITIVLVAGVVILADLAISAFWVNPFAKDLQEKFLDYESIQAKRIAYGIENSVDQIIQNSKEIAFNVGIMGEKSKEAEYILARFLRDNPEIKTVSIIDTSGQEVKKISVSQFFTSADLKNLSGSVEFIYAMTKELYIGPVYFSENIEPCLIIAAPIFSLSQQRTIGVLRIELNLRGILGVISEMQTSLEMRISVVDNKGNLIADSDFSRVLKGVNLRDLAPVKAVIIRGQDFKDLQNGQYLNEKGEKVVAVAASIKKFRWGVIIEEPAEKVLGLGQELNRFAIIFIMATIATLLILIWVAGILSKTSKELKQKYTQLEFQRNELEKTTKMLVRRDLELTGTRDRLREALIKSDKARVELGESKAALMNILGDAEETRAKLSTEEAALMNILEDAEETRAELNIEKNRIQTVISSLNDGLLVLDVDGRVVLVNPAAEKIFEIKEEWVLSKKGGELSQYPYIKTLFDEIAKNKICQIFCELELTLPSPSEKISEVVITPFKDEKENILGTVIAMHDVTRERHVERMKTEFVSLAAHQLRTPLSAIKWILRTVLDGDIGQISKEQAEMLEKGYKSNERMILLINDLLNVARIEEGRFIYNATYESIEEIIAKVVAGEENLIREKKIKFVFEKPPTPLPKIKVDVEKIELMLQNLLDNAIFYSKEGGKVTVAVKKDNMDNIEVMIQDAGIGIPLRQQDRLFNKFFRADNAVKMNVEGSGLGLFTVKHIIEAHGGKIRFESMENEGTTFWLTLPIQNHI